MPSFPDFTTFSPISLSIALVLTTIIAFVWHEILSRSRRKSLTFFFWLVFFTAMLFGLLWFLFFETFVSKELFTFFSAHFTYALFLSLIATGVIIELSKNMIVRFFGKKFFETIDDVVDLSFATALGFTATENIFHFYELFLYADTYDTPIVIIKEIISQVFFIIPIHLFCSGIFGYYYGLSLFAKPNQRTFWKKAYGLVQFIKGTFISITVYGLFFYIMTQDVRMGEVANFFGYENFPFNESLFPFISFIFSSLTALYLFEKMGNSDFITETKTEKIKREEKELADLHEQKGE